MTMRTVPPAVEAQGLVEYALILLMIALATFVSLQALGPFVFAMFTTAARAFPV